jgi:hypothetical protein
VGAVDDNDNFEVLMGLAQYRGDSAINQDIESVKGCNGEANEGPFSKK